MKSINESPASQLKGSAMVALSGALYGSLGYFGLRLMQADLSVNTMLFWRFIVSAVIVVVLAAIRGVSLKANRKSAALAFVFGALFYGSSSALYFVASRLIGTGLAMTIFFSYPAVVIFLAWLFKGKRLTRLTFSSLFTITVGLSMLKDPAVSTVTVEGVVIGLIAAVLYGSYIFVSEEQVKTLCPWVSTFYLCLGGAFTFLLLALWDGTFRIPLESRIIFDLMGICFFGTVIPVFLLLEGLKVVDAGKAAILSVFEPVVTVILGVVLLEELFTPLQVGGVLVVLAGAVLIQFGPGSGSSNKVILVRPTL